MARRDSAFDFEHEAVRRDRCNVAHARIVEVGLAVGGAWKVVAGTTPPDRTHSLPLKCALARKPTVITVFK